eukprot:jgi/Botrbrau1/20813/Bobra.0156s0041.1
MPRAPYLAHLLPCKLPRSLLRYRCADMGNFRISSVTCHLVFLLMLTATAKSSPNRHLLMSSFGLLYDHSLTTSKFTAMGSVKVGSTISSSLVVVANEPGGGELPSPAEGPAAAT